jgi:hypothetical protein
MTTVTTVTTPTTAAAAPHPPVHPASGVRASDAEREAVTDRLRAAAAEGRLTPAEADERQAAAYAAITRDELVPLTADLPTDPPPEQAASAPATRARGGRGGPLTDAARRRLAVHAVIVGVLAVFLVTRWAMDPAPFFWPVWPAFWLGVSLLLHHRWARRAEPPAAA